MHKAPMNWPRRPSLARHEAAGIAVVAALIAACSGGESPGSITGIVVEVSSNMLVPSELSEVRARVVTAAKTIEYIHKLDGARMPSRFLIEAGADKQLGFTLELDGVDDDVVIVTTKQDMAFVPGEVGLYTAWLQRACRGVVCAAGLTCGESEACVPVPRLTRWRGPLPPDGFTVDRHGLDVRDAAIDVATIVEAPMDAPAPVDVGESPPDDAAPPTPDPSAPEAGMETMPMAPT